MNFGPLAAGRSQARVPRCLRCVRRDLRDPGFQHEGFPSRFRSFGPKAVKRPNWRNHSEQENAYFDASTYRVIRPMPPDTDWDGSPVDGS